MRVKIPLSGPESVNAFRNSLMCCIKDAFPGILPEVLPDIELACGEATTNIDRAGDAVAVLSVRRDHTHLLVTIRARSHRINRKKIQRGIKRSRQLIGNTGDCRECGRGLPIIRAMTDSFYVNARGDLVMSFPRAFRRRASRGFFL